MTNIRSAFAAGLLVLGTAVVASAQATPAQGARGQHGQQGARGMNGGPGFGRGGGAVLKGIQLTDAEKANVKSVHAKYAPQMKALREQLKPQGNQARAQGQRPDSAAMRARWEQNAPQREQMKKLMDAERADLRAALSTANQAKFDANVQEIQQRVAQRGDKANGKPSGRGGRRAPGPRA